MRSERRVFVIMPFVRGGTRNEAQLASFFTNNLKRPIETTELQHQYVVYRSGQAFNITAEIIRDLCRADLVIADLSGEEPNPNVMYELGLRLAVSDRPVILIREKMPQNRRAFDIYGFYTFDYDPYDYEALHTHLIDKIGNLETGTESYDNPVLTLVREQLALMNPDPMALAPEQQRELVLRGIRSAVTAIERAFGPYGSALAVDSVAGETLLIRRGAAIVKNLASSNPFEDRGIRLMGEAAQQIVAELGDGSKVSVILAGALVERGLEATSAGAFPPDLLRGITDGIAAAVHGIRSNSLAASLELLSAVARTAAKNHVFDSTLLEAVATSGPDDLVRIENGGYGESEVVVSNNFVVDRGVVSPEFLRGERAILSDAYVLLYVHKITVLRELLPLFEKVAGSGRPLLIVADSLEGEARAALVYNVGKPGTVRVVPIKSPGFGGRRFDVLEDLAVFTGGQVVSKHRGMTLETTTLAHLGQADQVIIETDRTEIIGGRGSSDVISQRADVIRSLIRSSSNEYDRSLLRERLAGLVGRVITIIVRGGSPGEERQRRSEIESALEAATAAGKSGCVPGGGTAYMHAAAAVAQVVPDNEDHAAGLNVVISALEAPTRALVINSGRHPEGVIVQLQNDASGVLGFNAATRKVQDLFQVGIVDSSLVAVRALELGASAARTYLEAGSWSIKVKAEQG